MLDKMLQKIRNVVGHKIVRKKAKSIAQMAIVGLIKEHKKFLKTVGAHLQNDND